MCLFCGKKNHKVNSKEKVKNIMSKKLVFLKKNDSIKKAIELFLKVPDSAIPVVDKKKRCIGEVRQRDLLRLVINPEDIEGEEEILGPSKIKELMEKYAKKVSDLMKTHEVKTNPDEGVAIVAKMMLEEDIYTLPVIENKKLVGIISESDILKHLIKKPR